MMCVNQKPSDCFPSFSDWIGKAIEQGFFQAQWSTAEEADVNFINSQYM